MARAEALLDDAFLRQREQTPGGEDLVAPYNHRAVVQRRVRVEDRLQELGRDLAIDADPGGRVVLETNIALEGDQRAGTPGAQPLGRPDRLRDGLAVLRCA